MRNMPCSSCRSIPFTREVIRAIAPYRNDDIPQYAVFEVGYRDPMPVAVIDAIGDGAILRCMDGEVVRVKLLNSTSSHCVARMLDTDAAFTAVRRIHWQALEGRYPEFFFGLAA